MIFEPTTESLLANIETLLGEIEEVQARAERAEAEVERLRAALVAIEAGVLGGPVGSVRDVIRVIESVIGGPADSRRRTTAPPLDGANRDSATAQREDDDG